MAKLPVVTAETVAAVEEAMRDGGPNLLQVHLDKIQAENPLLANQIRQWVKTTGINPVAAVMGAVTIYHLLSAQAESDSVKIG